MIEQNVKPPNAIGPIRDHRIRRVCGLSGLDTTRQKLIELRKLRASLELSIRELESERRKEEVINKGLLVARFTKATCDGFISMASAMVKAVMGEKVASKAEAVEKFYSAATPVAESVTNAMLGQKVDTGGTAAAVLKNVPYLATKNLGYRLLGESAAVKTEVIHAALNAKDKKEILKPAASYLYELHTTLGDEWADIVAKEKGVEHVAGHKVTALAKIAKSAFEYNEALGKAFEEMESNEMDTVQRHIAQKQTLVHMAKLLARKIEDLEKILASQSPPQRS